MARQEFRQADRYARELGLEREFPDAARLHAKARITKLVRKGSKGKATWRLAATLAGSDVGHRALLLEVLEEAQEDAAAATLRREWALEATCAATTLSAAERPAAALEDETTASESSLAPKSFDVATEYLELGLDFNKAVVLVDDLASLRRAEFGLKPLAAHCQEGNNDTENTGTAIGAGSPLEPFVVGLDAEWAAVAWRAARNTKGAAGGPSDEACSGPSKSEDHRAGLLAGRKKRRDKRSDKATAALLQVATAEVAFLFDLPKLLRREPIADAAAQRGLDAAGGAQVDAPRPETSFAFDSIMSRLFGDQSTIKLGFGFRQDLAVLARSYPEVAGFRACAPLLEVGDILRGVAPSETGLSLSSACQGWLGKPLDKTEQCSDWTARPLRLGQLVYAANDAHVLVRLFFELTRRRLPVHLAAEENAPQTPPSRAVEAFWRSRLVSLGGPEIGPQIQKGTTQVPVHAAALVVGDENHETRDGNHRTSGLGMFSSADLVAWALTKSANVEILCGPECAFSSTEARGNGGGIDGCNCEGRASFSSLNFRVVAIMVAGEPVLAATACFASARIGNEPNIDDSKRAEEPTRSEARRSAPYLATEPSSPQEANRSERSESGADKHGQAKEVGTQGPVVCVRSVAAAFGVTKRDVRFASRSECRDFFGAEPGLLPPFPLPSISGVSLASPAPPTGPAPTALNGSKLEVGAGGGGGGDALAKARRSSETPWGPARPVRVLLDPSCRPGDPENTCVVFQAGERGTWLHLSYLQLEALVPKARYIEIAKRAPPWSASAPEAPSSRGTPKIPPVPEKVPFVEAAESASPEAPALLMDAMLGRLAKRLRVMGADTVLWPRVLALNKIGGGYDETALRAHLAAWVKSGRTLVTRDSKLAKAAARYLEARHDRGEPPSKGALSSGGHPGEVLLLMETSTETQFAEVVRTQGLSFKAADFMSRCAECNKKGFDRVGRNELQALSCNEAAEKDRAEEPDERPCSVGERGARTEWGLHKKRQMQWKKLVARLPTHVLETVEEFWACRKCGKLFWEGPKFETACLKYLGLVEGA